MKRMLPGAVAVMLAAAILGQARGAEPGAIVEKAIEAAGGKEKLDKLKIVTWKAKGKLTLQGAENPLDTVTTAQGLDHIRAEFKAEFGGMPFEGMTVIAGDKGWRKFAGQTMEMDAASIANEKRTIALQLMPVLLTPLLSDAYKLASGGEADVAGKTADGVLVTPREGKAFTIYFSRETGLPVKLKAEVLDFTGAPFEQESLYTEYVEMNGIQKAKKIVSMRDGEAMLSQEISEFKSLDSAPEGAFAAP